MKLNVSTVLKALDGSNLVDRAQKPVTLKEVVIEALLNPLGSDAMGGQEKYSMMKLAEKVHRSAGEVDVTVEELVLIKNRVGCVCTPLVTGRAFDLLEGREQ